jgi:hypothetical protein
MADSVQSQLKQLLDNFGIQLAKDLEVSMNKALKDGRKRGKGGPQQAALQFNPEIKTSKSSFVLNIKASGDYWYYIEKGRKKGKMPPPSVFDKEYMGKNNIRVQDIMLDITKAKKKPSYLKAVKQFAWIMARSIGRNGIKPKPFRDRVINDGRIDKLEQDVAKIIGKDITIQLTGI